MSLPIVNNLEKLSYSSAIDLKNCGHYFKLAHIDGHPVFQDTIETKFGQVIHLFLQAHLQGAPIYDVVAQFETEWKSTWEENQNLVTPKNNFEDLRQVGVNVLRSALPTFNKELPFKEVVSVEWRFAEPVFPDKYKQVFKGFVDIIFRREDGTYIVGDIKTCGSAYMFKNYQDKYKEYQLILYKHFFAKVNGIDPKNIDTCFILLEKDPKTKNPIQFSHITSGKVKTENALEWIDKSLSAINRGVFLKNRTHCHAFNRTCIFYETDLCKR